MKIIVCIKQVPDLNDIKLDPATNTLIRNTRSQIINPVDMNALEAGISIKEKKAGSVSVISMGTVYAKDALLEALSMGADNAYLLNDRLYAGSDTYATANTLKVMISHLGEYSLIITGNKASDGETGQTGSELAEALGIPQINNVVKIYKINKKYIIAKSMNENGYSIIFAKLPALITVVKALNTPRLINMKNLYQALNKKINIIDNTILKIPFDKCGLPGSPTKVIKINTARYDKKISFISGSTPVIAEKIIKIIFEKTRSLSKADKETPLIKIFGKKKILLIGELNNNRLNNSIFSLIDESKKLSAKIRAELSILFTGYKINKNIIKKLDLHRVFFIDKKELKNFDPALSASYISEFIKAHKPEIVLGSATLFGRALFPRIAAKVHTGLTADCAKLEINKNAKLLQIRPAIGGNIYATIICPDKNPQMATFNPLYKNSGKKEYSPQFNNVDGMNMTKTPAYTKTLFTIIKKHDSSIQEAELIISGGRGIGGKHGFTLLNKLAELTGGKIGASRSAVEAGWINYPRQIGQTGTTVRPKVYLACGISGAVQHLAGMKSSDTIIAVNKDPKAEIFGASDFGVIADYRVIIEEIIKQLKEKNKNER